jgi:dTDP-4-dehydrorhamnose reductase
MGEVMVKDCLEKYLIFRLSWVFGYGQQNFIYKFLQWCKGKHSLNISSDEVSIPTCTKTIVDITLKSLDKGISGLYHLTNSGYASRYEWAKSIIKIMKLNNIVYPVPKEIFNLPAKRPAWSPMDNKRISDLLGMEIPFWEDAVKNYLIDLK